MSDPCQCLFDHETAMRRLISWLRESQDYCTDTECLPDGPAGIGGNSLLMWSLLWGLLAMAMFMLRPNSMRQQPRDAVNEKRGPNGDGNDQGNNNGPPPPGLT